MTRERGPSSPAPSDERDFFGDQQIYTWLRRVFGPGVLHHKRLLSIAQNTVGVMHATSLFLSAIGEAYAQHAGKLAKHAIKQVDRFLSNPAYDLWKLAQPWTAFLVGQRKHIVIALDWTDFDDDDHTTLYACLVTRHGRATPLCWKTVHKSTLEGQRNRYEYELIDQLDRVLDPTVRVTLLADRGFGNQDLYQYLQGLGWDFIIRFRGNILVQAQGIQQPAKQWLFLKGQPRMLRSVRVTEEKTFVEAVVVVRDPGMKDIWCLATTLDQRTAKQIVRLYGKRFTIEETFRDCKDLRFGMGLRATHIKDATRRDRLLLLAALAQVLLVLLGAAAEEAGLDRHQRANTSKERTHSLFRQGCYWYRAIAKMRLTLLLRLIAAFERLVALHAVSRAIFFVV